MAFTHRQSRTASSGGTSATSFSFSFSSVPVAGNMVVVRIRIVSNSATVDSVTDTAGNTYTKIHGPITNPGNGTRDYMFYAIQTTGGATSMTANYSTSVFSGAIYSEFGGGGPLETSSTGTGTGTSGAPTTLTPAAAGELIVSILETQQSSGTITPGSGYTIGTSENVTAALEYKLSGTTSEVADFSWVNSVNGWVILAAAFQSTTTSTSSSISTSTSVSTSTSASSTSASTSVSTSTSISTSISTSSTSMSTSTSTTTLLTSDIPILGTGPTIAGRGGRSAGIGFAPPASPGMPIKR